MKFNSAISLFLIQLVLFTSIFQQFPSSNGENILFYFVITGYSHLNSILPLIDKLIGNGHNITVLASMDPKKAQGENLSIIVSNEVHSLLSDVWDVDADLIKERQGNRQNNVLDPLFEISLESCRTILHSSQTQTLIYNTKFDLVIIDEDGNQCGMALAVYKYKAKFIFYSAFTFFGFMYDEYGVPLETSSIPDAEYGRSMNYWERLKSTLRTSVWTYYWHYYTFEPMAELIKDVLHLNETPSISGLYQYTSLVLINTHPSTDYARSLPPLFVSVSGMHITEERKMLPKDLDNFISKPGSIGFIYISFGTSVRISKSNTEIREKLFYAMGNTSMIQFVWKWEGEEYPTDAPSNIYFSEWLPQQDLYAHKRIKGAITHCGINGMHEAVYFGVPMIMFPIVYDQDFNANSMATKGVGTKLEMSSFTQNDLQTALNQILTNSSIKQAIREVSKLYKDRPMSPTDTAFWWVEHVLRHKNSTSYLVPLSLKQRWYERRLLDVWILIFLILAIVMSAALFVSYKLLKYAITIMLGHNSLTILSTKDLHSRERLNGYVQIKKEN